MVQSIQPLSARVPNPLADSAPSSSQSSSVNRGHCVSYPPTAMPQLYYPPLSSIHNASHPFHNILTALPLSQKHKMGPGLPYRHALHLPITDSLEPTSSIPLRSMCRILITITTLLKPFALVVDYHVFLLDNQRGELYPNELERIDRVFWNNRDLFRSITSFEGKKPLRRRTLL